MALLYWIMCGRMIQRGDVKQTEGTKGGLNLAEVTPSSTLSLTHIWTLWISCPDHYISLLPAGRTNKLTMNQSQKIFSFPVKRLPWRAGCGHERGMRGGMEFERFSKSLSWLIHGIGSDLLCPLIKITMQCEIPTWKWLLVAELHICAFIKLTIHPKLYTSWTLSVSDTQTWPDPLQLFYCLHGFGIATILVSWPSQTVMVSQQSPVEKTAHFHCVGRPSLNSINLLFCSFHNK